MRHRVFAFALLSASLLSPAVHAQKMSTLDRQRSEEMLALTVKEVKKHYYDPNLHGTDLDARAKEARTRIENAQTLGQAFTAIGWLLDGLNDSHTYFVPPLHTLRTEYGFQMQMVGERCYVTRVKPGSDAEGRGLKPGDEVIEVNGFPLARGDYEKFEYVFYLLRPLPVLHLTVRSPGAAQKSLDVLSKQHEEKRTYSMFDLPWLISAGQNEEKRQRTEYYEGAGGSLIVKLKSFLLADSEVEQLLDKMRGKKSLLLDLRGNGGGAVEVLARLLGGCFDHDLKIGERVGRDQKKPEVIKKTRNPLTGQVVVLIDSHSASASELFARVIQLEKRGTVVGDRSAGLVMEARYFDYEIGGGVGFGFGLMITDADIRMSDGNSLERKGVVPDELVLPTAEDLASGRDPALSRGAALLGVNISPEKAGMLFPFKWPKN